MTANVIWIAAIIQRPVIRLRTSRSARRRDSSENRSARSPERPIVLPSRMPETESDSCTIDETSASDTWRSAVTFLRWSPTRFVSQTKSGSRIRAKTARRQSSSTIATTVAMHGRHVREHRGRGRGDDGVDAADVVGDPALHVARARAGEEREREPLQVPVDGRAQVVHHGLADPVREQRLVDADRAGDDRDQDHPGDEEREQAQVVLGDRRVEDAVEQERRDHAERRREDDQREDDRELRPVGPEEREDPAQVRPPHRGIGRPLRRLGRAIRLRSGVQASA